MALSDLAALGSFVSGLAVLVSLIYLALQIRQSDRHQRSVGLQARADRLVETYFRLADPEMQEVMNSVQSGDDKITLAQLGQFEAIFKAVMYGADDAFRQHKAGLVSDDVFEGYRASLRDRCAGAGWRAMWKRRRHFWGHEFREFVDRLVADAPVASIPSPADALASWRAEVAAERDYSSPVAAPRR
jgi:hypothetical protein